jgi:CBS domain containing-hemolysin-like protein
MTAKGIPNARRAPSMRRLILRAFKLKDQSSERVATPNANISHASSASRRRTARAIFLNRLWSVVKIVTYGVENGGNSGYGAVRQDALKPI